MLKILLFLQTLYLSGFVIVICVLESTDVQNALLPYVTEQLSAALKTKVSVGRIELELFDKIVIKDFYIEDDRGEVLLTAKQLKIGAFQVPTLAWLADREKVRHINVRLLELQDVRFNLYRRRADEKFNLDFLFAGEKKDEEPKDTLPGPLVAVDVAKVKLSRVHFSLRDSTFEDSLLAPIPNRLNYTYLDFPEVNLEGSFRLSPEKQMFVSIQRLETQERRSGIVLKHFSTELQASLDTVPVKGEGPKVHFFNTSYQQGNTDLHFDLTMDGETLGSLFRKGRNRRYILNIRPSTLDFASANIYFPHFVSDLPLKGIIRAEGLIEGSYRKIKSRQLKIKYNQHTDLTVAVRLDDFTKPEKLFLQATLTDSKIDPEDLERLLPGILDLPPQIKNLGPTFVNGKFTGFIKDFVADGVFVSKLGKVTSDINLKFQENKIAYSGRIATESFNLDGLLGSKISDNLTIRGEMRGENFDFANAVGDFNFYIQNSRLTNFTLDSAHANIQLDHKKIVGTAKLNDKEGSFDTRVNIDFSGVKPKYELLGNVNNIDLKHYGITPDIPYKFSTIFNVDIEGDSLDNLQGAAKFYELHFYREADKNHPEADSLAIRNISIRSERNDSVNKHFNVRTSLFDFDMTGSYTYAQVYENLQKLFEEGELFFKNDTTEIQQYYAKRSVPNDNDMVRFYYQFNATDINPLLDFFHAGVYVAPNTEVGGRFQFGETTKSDIYLSCDSLRLADITFRNIQLDTFHLRKPAMENKPDMDAALYCKEIYISKKLNFQDIRLSSRWNADQIEYAINIDQDSLDNQYRFAGTALFRQGSIFSHLDSIGSYLRLGDSLWVFSRDNDLRYSAGELQIDNFSVSHNQQRITLSSNIVKGTEDKLAVKLDEVNLELVNHFTKLNAPFAGNVNCILNVRQLFSQPVAQLNGSALGFRYGNTQYGDVTVRSDWNDAYKVLQLAVRLSQRGDTLLTLGGYYDPQDTLSPLDFTVGTNGLPLSLLEPFVEGVLYDLKGIVNLKGVRIGGRFSEPVVVGKAQIDTQFGVSYFKTKHHLQGEILIDEEAFRFSNQKVYAVVPNGNKPNENDNFIAFDGALFHNRFSRLSIEVFVTQVKNYLLINTNKLDNDLYYGTLTLTDGTAVISGPPEKLSIIASADVGTGTVFNVPVSGYNKKQRLEYVSFQDDLNDQQKAPKKEAFGLDMKLTVNAKPEAAVNIIFDEKVGDKISGRGRGTLNLDISTEGTFLMDGQYEITQGDYLFTFRNIINKKFIIEPGGTINWAGDPYNARLDLKAIFRVEQVNLRSWDSTQTQALNMDVVMGLKGSLLSPEINFALETPATALLTYNVQSTMRMIQNDPQELNRQVFSLLMLRTVTPIGKFFADNAANTTGGGVSSSMGEFLSAQLNNLISQTIDKNLNVSVGFNRDVLLLNLKASLLNDRVTIERNGAIVSNANRDLSLGNITVQVKLLPRAKQQAVVTTGRLALEVFNRENVTSQALASTSRGVGVFFRKDFNKLSDVFPFLKPKKKKKPTQQLPNSTDPQGETEK